jgi:hypothetical protein
MRPARILLTTLVYLIRIIHCAGNSCWDKPSGRIDAISIDILGLHGLKWKCWVIAGNLFSQPSSCYAGLYK